ncbi:MAG: cell division protein ZipA C-terminal FtsZ-binding domain-containing protein [Salinisphaera sp.]|nr:cell division protein ZipA C-terminal FtsZ-binding domain-containing protein [Salinisphaera sp.]
MEWLWLILVALAVAGVYLYLRRQSGQDPWRGVDEPAEADLDRGMSLGGDSYVVGVRSVPRPEQPAAPPEDEPSWETFRTEPGNEFGAAPPPQRQPRAKKKAPPPPPQVERKVFVIHVASRDGAQYDGPDIHAALAEQKLSFGLNSVYHRIHEVDGVPESVFAVANMLKPGFLDPVEQDHLQTGGLTLILQLPGPVEGARAARDMLDTAHGLAQRLGAEVLDDKRNTLAAQSAQYLLDQVAEIDRQQRLGSLG